MLVLEEVISVLIKRLTYKLLKLISVGLSMEKLKPVVSKSSISSLKFQRKSDFKKFLNFIKKQTKELGLKLNPVDHYVIRFRGDLK